MFKKKRKPIVEYIFVDVQRLESYITQIKGAVNYDFIPTWSAGLSMTGLIASGGLQKVGRKQTYHEMITHLLSHLRKTGQLDTKRESEPGKCIKQVLFCLETCVARKALFPSDLTADIPGIQELALWISLEPEKAPGREKLEYPAGPLYLIESYFKDDSRWYHAYTGYSAFSYMLETFNTLGNKFRELKEVKKLKMLKSWKQDEEIEELARRFAIDPFEYLVGLKAQVSAPRRIECLYRRRATMIDLASRRVVTFGYPIFIANAT